MPKQQPRASTSAEQVSKRVDGRSGPCPDWIKVRNPDSLAIQRERSENWNR